jgi:PAS domain S-box-containing protein
MHTAMEGLLDASASSLILFDDVGVIELASIRAESMFGYPRRGLRGRSVNTLLAEASRRTVARSSFELLQGEDEASPRMTSVRAVRLDGSEFEATLSLNVVSHQVKPLLAAMVVTAASNAGPLEQFSLALEAAPTSMILSDKQGTIVLVNAQTERMFGYQRGELIGLTLERLVPARLRAEHERHRRNFFRNAQTRAMGAGQDLYGVRKDNQEIPIEIGLNALTVNGQRFVLSSVVDITERKRALSHFRLALEAAPTGMLLVDDSGRILLMNAQIENIFGYSHEDLMGQPLERLVPLPSRALHPRLRHGFFLEASSRPMGAGRELYGLHRDGHEVPVEIALTTLDAREGRLVLTSVVDITERKRVERALRDNEARYSELFDASPVALFEQDFSETRRYLQGLLEMGITDLDAHLTDRPHMLLDALSKVRTVRVNQQALNLFEAPNAEALQILAAEPTPATLDWFRVSLCHMLAGERRFSLEARTPTLSGQMRTLSTHLHVLPGYTDTWSRVVLSVFDLTAHERVEAQLRASLHDKEILLKEVHHRVKNNLQIVSSLLNMKSEVADDPTTRQVFEDCQARIQSLAFIHEQLYVSGDLSHVPFEHYVRTLVEHLRSSFGPPSRRVDSRIDIADIHLSIDDAIPCGLIVNELVTNALKHAFPRESDGMIEVSMRRPDPGQFELIVSDNGRGLPPELDPQSAESTGLDLVYTFAEQLRAEVTLVRVGGTRFEFRFKRGASMRKDDTGD